MGRGIFQYSTKLFVLIRQTFWFLSQVPMTLRSQDSLIGQLNQLSQLSQKLWVVECLMLYKVVCIDKTRILVFVPGPYDLPFSS